MRVLHEGVEDLDDLLLRQDVDAVLEGVLHVQALVEDLVRPDALAQVVAQHRELVRERLLVLGEEDVAADVGAEPLGAEAAREPADAVVGLEHLDVAPEKVGGEEAGNASAKDADVVHRGGL